MCGGRGISEPPPLGTRSHTPQIWHWTRLPCLSVCFPQHMSSSILAPRIHTLVIWQHTIFTTASLLLLRAEDVCLCLWIVLEISVFLYLSLFMQSVYLLLYKSSLPSFGLRLPSWLCISIIGQPLLFSMHIYLFCFDWLVWLHSLSLQLITIATEGRIGQPEEPLGFFFPSGPCWQMRWYHCT